MNPAISKLLICVLVPCAAIAGNETWSLPTNPQAVVLELKYAAASGSQQRTALRLHRDGSFTGNVGASHQVRGRLSASEMRALLTDVIDASGALRLTSEGLRKQIQSEGRRTGRPARVQAAEDMIVRLVLAGGAHEIRCTAPEVLRTRYPMLSDLERVCTIRRRLENVVAVAHAGGLPAAERLAALATAQLRRQNNADVRVTARDLQSVRGRAGDLRQLQFVVSDNNSGGALRREFHVSVMESPDAPLRISVTPLTAPL